MSTLPKSHWPCPQCMRNVGVYYTDPVKRDTLAFVEHYSTNSPDHGAKPCAGSGDTFSIRASSGSGMPTKATGDDKHSFAAPLATVFTTCGRCGKRVQVVSSLAGPLTAKHTFTSSGSECVGSGQRVTFKDVN